MRSLRAAWAAATGSTSPVDLPSEITTIAAGVEPGDVITEIDGQPIGDASDVSRIINGKKPGDHIELRVDRSGQDIRLGAALANRPARTP